MTPKFTPTIAICALASLATAVGLAAPGPDVPVESSAPSPYPSDQAAAENVPAKVEIADFAFRGTLSVAAGQSIEVTNLDGAGHTLSAQDGSFDTGVLNGGASGAINAPAAPGTYAFICQIHPTMTGTLEVR